MQSVDTDAQFVYNENGLRVKKTVNGVVTDYILHGKNIVHMKRGDDELHFFYDAQNKPAVVVFNGTAYAYLYNQQDDVIGLLDSNGTHMVSYTYDAWGKPISKTGTLASTLGTSIPSGIAATSMTKRQDSIMHPAVITILRSVGL